MKNSVKNAKIIYWEEISQIVKNFEFPPVLWKNMISIKFANQQISCVDFWWISSKM